MQTQEIKVVVIPNECAPDNRIQRVDDVLPDSLASQITVDLVPVVLNNHPSLCGWNPCSFPGKPFRADYCPV